MLLTESVVCASLQSNTNVTYLDLSDNGLGTEGAIAIATMMKENCYITQLVSCVGTILVSLCIVRMCLWLS